MTTTNEYTKQAEEFLQECGITFTSKFIGSDCPQSCSDRGKDMDKVDEYPRKNHIHGKHYVCTFKRNDTSKGPFSIDFWNSYADAEFNYWLRNRPTGSLENKYAKPGHSIFGGKARLVTAYDVLASITKSDPGTFDDFCSDFGYDSDSRKAEQTYQAVQDEWRKVRSFFTKAEIEKLQEIS